jgi:hypothetical protein
LLCSVCNQTSSCRSNAGFGFDVRRFAIVGGSPASRGSAQRNGASASSVTIHGDTVDRKFFARKGPSGIASQPCTSRADQSLSRLRPKMWFSASSIAIDRPRSLPAPTQKASSIS